ncbi:MAG: long-chain-acyl-CoA synthetase [Marinobacter sp.]|uniref:long-chain-acyl-CoA synthetase n=1 Tax=Marinobacter sp. TaxID=50741 RepID=UPI001B510A86|nr:long-chain-acyl-CoA synthetase [Marinobacter sp.]MBQ0745578.1 long-chain-acyl-CoA synthetase [Marinobacter sp.]MBQ0814375.1 long-chain-acyl-CoA synthetase [Marinobacter sp.]|tara:strand:- start:8383 stop:10206 length:1824 start_codon:yes stop_codon:yes gene_type:complete
MSQDKVRAMDIARRLPGIMKRFPAIAKGLYYYSIKDAQKTITLGTLVENNAEKYANRPAILFEDRSITWGDFNAWSNRIAGYFQAQGLKKGDSIAVFLENRPEVLAVIAGAAKIGVACAMLNSAQKGKVLEHSINLVTPKMVVVGEELVSAFDDVKASLQLDHPTPFLFLADTNTLNVFGDAPSGYANMAQQVSTINSDNPVLSDPPRTGDTAIYLFTSGTTGLPKAAPGSHNKFLKAYGGFGLMSLAMKPEDVFYCTLPLYHGTGLVVCWGSVLAGGSALALRRKFSASAFWDDVRRYDATVFGYIGELCRYLLNQPPSEQDRNHGLTKMLGNGLRPSIWKEFKERFGIETISELYASSEGNIGFSNFFNLDNTVGMSTASYKLVKFHDGTRDPVRNDKGTMQEVAKGDPGLLVGEITKKWSFEGYTQKEATEKSILRDAFKKGDAWFNTGDVLREIGCRHLQFVDRMGDTYRWKGENVSTNEVENILDGSGMVEEAIVYGVEIPKTNGKAGMVTLVPNSETFDIDKLLGFLRDNLPAYAVPVFVRVTQAIEKTGTFKYRKVDIQKAGYALERPHEEVFAWLPKTDGYIRLTPELVSEIDSGQFNF